MRRLAQLVVRRRWWVVAAAVVFVPIAAVVGGDVASRLVVGGFEDPGATSTRAAQALARDFPRSSQSDFVLVVTARDGDVDADAVAEAGLALTEELDAAPGVRGAGSYWTLGSAAPLRSRDGDRALVFAGLEGETAEQIETAERLSEELTVSNDVIETAATGRAEVARQVSEQAETDLHRSELLTAPITFVALVIVFGSLVAALLPLAVGILAVLGTFVVLVVLSLFTDVSVFALNLTTGLGLGLAIDYSLFVVSRYREELEAGATTRVAVGRTMQTAGRTVAFSAGTVAVSLLALLIFPVDYLRSFAYAGVAVVALAAVASIVVLPAVLAVLGPRVEKGRLFRVRPPSEDGFWGRQAQRVMRRPVLYAVGVSAVLLALAIPFFHFEPGLTDDRVVPDSVSSRAATDLIREGFASRESDALQVLVPDVDPDDPAVRDEIDAVARRLATVPGVARVDTVTGYYLPADDGSVTVAGPNDLSSRFLPGAGKDGTWFAVVPTVEPISVAGERLVREVRAVDTDLELLVAGSAARFVDTKAAVTDRLPAAIGIIAVLTFLLLFMMTGSVLVPLKALLLNVLSLTATFGAMVWIFQDGNLSGLLGFTPTGQIDVFTPILMFCIAFGLSMDYEVFLLSRIKEEYDLEHDNERAVVVGLAKTGRIVTAAALLLTIVFVGIATSQVTDVKLFGVGLTLAVLVDAFLVRATLVPAFMRLAGRANWWSPKPLRRFHLRYGIWENEPIAILDRAFEASTR